MKAAFLLGVLIFPVSLFAQSPKQKRLVGQAYYVSQAGGYVLQDSAHYKYSGSRGSRFDQEHLRYTDLQNLGSSPDADFTSQRIPAHNIDSAGLPHADYDSAWFAIGINQVPPGTFRNTEAHYYNPDGSISQVYQSVTDPSNGSLLYGHRSIEVYSAGRLSRSYIFGFNGVNVDTSFVRDFVYNGAGQLVADSLSLRLTAGNYIPYRNILFAYGSAPNYIASTLYSFRPSPSRLVPDLLDSLSYHPDGRLQSRKSFFMGDGGRFLPESLDSFSYTAGTRGYTSLREDVLDTFGIAEYTFFTVTDRVNSRGQKDSMTISGFRGAASLGNQRISVTYDSDGDPSTRTDYFTGTGTAPYSIEYYHYEELPGLRVTPGIADAVRLSLFPNPCTDQLSYNLRGLAGGTPISIEVYNLTGQLVYREMTHWSGTSQRLILGAEAPAGNYVLRVKAGAENAGSSLQFTRL